MSLRVAVLISASLCLSAPWIGQAAAAKAAALSRDRDTSASPARERQKRCGAEWRGLSGAEKSAKGPNWPQFYSKCVKRLKEPRA